MKKFEIGLSDRITPAEYKGFLDTYAGYIDFVYYSVPFRQFQTRATMFAANTLKQGEEHTRRCLELFKNYGIKTELCLNAWNLTENDIRLARSFCARIGIMPDALVFLDEYLGFVQKYFPDRYYIYSYNNALRNAKDVARISAAYNEAVVIPQYSGNRELWRAVREKGMNLRLLINNGCSPNCATCRNARFCRTTAEKNILLNGIEHTFAHQSVFPSELHQVFENEPDVTSYKISSRPSDIKYITDCMKVYVEDNDKSLNESKDYSLICRLMPLREHLEGIDLDSVYSIKSAKWGNYNPFRA